MGRPLNVCCLSTLLGVIIMNLNLIVIVLSRNVCMFVWYAALLQHRGILYHHKSSTNGECDLAFIDGHYSHTNIHTHTMADEMTPPIGNHPSNAVLHWINGRVRTGSQLRHSKPKKKQTNCLILCLDFCRNSNERLRGQLRVNGIQV